MAVLHNASTSLELLRYVHQCRRTLPRLCFAVVGVPRLIWLSSSSEGGGLTRLGVVGVSLGVLIRDS